MSLNSVTTSTTVYATAPGSVTGYNTIRDFLVDIIGTGSNGYGYQSIGSAAVSSSTGLIRAQDWRNFKNNIELLDIHLNTATSTSTIVYPSSGDVIDDSFTNNVITLLNSLESIRYNRPQNPSQRSTYVSSSTWTELNPSRLSWGTSIEHEILLTWNTSTDVGYFFNLGGRLSFALSYPAGSYTGANAVWKSLVDTYANAMTTATYTRSDFLAGGTKTDKWSISTNTATVSYTKVSNTSVSITVTLDNSFTNTNLVITNSSTYEYSVGAFTAPQPRVTLVNFFGDTYTPIAVPTKILSVTTPSAYSWATGNTSAAQTINITNNGNTTATISSITFSNASAVTQVTNFAGLGGTTSFTLTPSQTKSFTLAYSGSTVGGAYNSSFTVLSDNDSGAITVPTTQTITAIPFSFTVIPSSVTAVSTGLSVYRQDFVLDITPSEATAQFSAAFSSSSAPPGSAGWSISVNNSTAAPIEGSSYRTGPTVLFSPIGTTSTSFAATAVLDISLLRTDTSGSASQTVNMNLAWSNPVDPVTTRNLGTWLSPMAAYNSVVGMSYDLIDGERYLTIGVGMDNQARGGGDTVNLNAGGGVSFASTMWLGTDTQVDPGFKQGQPQYYGFNQRGNWSQFLRNFGVWPKENSGEPLNYNVGITAKYRFNIATTGTYYYEYSSDDDSSFAIIACDEYGIVSTDSQVYFLPDQLTTGAAQSNWNQSYTGEIELPAGKYVLSIEYQDNVGGPTAAAFQITDSSGVAIWNTLYPVRGYSNVYPYWQEAMRFRIPAAGTAKTIYSYYQYVKNSYEVNNKWHWGDLFDGGLFKVDDDGAGNVTVEFFGAARSPLISEVPDSLTFAAIRETLRSLPASFYYYLPPTVLERYTNLDSEPAGDGTQTRYFRGFDRDGNVITVLSSIPSNIPYPVIPGGGSGGERSPGDRDPFNPGEDVLRPPAES